MKLATTDIFKKLYLKNSKLVLLGHDDLKKLQKKLLMMAQDIIEVLESIHANYHLTGGTCLGAIRHQGFIPWDDDMDIDLARKDVANFLKTFTQKYGDKYYIHTPYNKDGFSLPSIQIRLKNTLYVGVNDYKEEESGIPIDIAIIENTYDFKILRKIHGIGSMALGLIVSCRKFAAYRNFYLELVSDLKEETKIFKKKILIGRLFSFFSLAHWIRIYDKWNSRCHNNASKFVVVPTGRKGFFGEIYDRDKFYESTKANFENYSWNVPKDYDYYLTKMYDDYMKLPAKREVERHALIKFKL